MKGNDKDMRLQQTAFFKIIKKVFYHLTRLPNPKFKLKFY